MLMEVQWASTCGFYHSSEWATPQLLGDDTPQTEQYCDARAESKTTSRKNACEAKGGVSTGECTGTPAAIPGGCQFLCAMVCTEADSLMITLPSGF